MRQVALVALLTQVGGFILVESTRSPILDRVFTRIGASGDIAGGQSTLMREMSELTGTLHNATGDPLVLLDEVGCGTSTTNGLVIIRAVTEFPHDEVGAAMLFTVHYHDLTGAADGRVDVFNPHFTAARRDGKVALLHNVIGGPLSSSYGVEMARLVSVPAGIVEWMQTPVDEPEIDADAECAADTGGDGITAATDDEPDETAEDGTLAAYVDGLGNGY